MGTNVRTRNDGFHGDNYRVCIHWNIEPKSDYNVDYNIGVCNDIDKRLYQPTVHPLSNPSFVSFSFNTTNY